MDWRHSESTAARVLELEGKVRDLEAKVNELEGEKRDLAKQVRDFEYQLELETDWLVLEGQVTELKKKKQNPHLLFGEGSFHGGVWRCSYTIGTIGIPSAVSFYLTAYRLPIVAALAAIPAWTAWLVGAM